MLASSHFQDESELTAQLVCLQDLCFALFSIVLSFSERTLEVKDSEDNDLKSDANHLKSMIHQRLSKESASRIELSSRLTDFVDID